MIRVNQFSESALGFKWNGVHTAFLNSCQAVRLAGRHELKVNAASPSEILHAHTFGPLYWLMRLLHRGKVVLHGHATPETMLGQLLGARRLFPFIQGYLRRYYESADLILCMTAQLQERLRQMGVQRPMAVMPLPIDLSAFRPDDALRREGRKLLGIGRTQKVALCAGQIIPRKGLDDFLETARLNPAIQFVWAGEIPFSLATQSYFRNRRHLSRPRANVIFPGVFELGRMPRIFNAADFFFFPSLQETFGLAVAEAAACGLPLLLRELPTYVESFGKSFLAARDAQGFSVHLRRLSGSASLRRRWGAKALAMARRFEPGRLARRMAGVYETLLKEEA
jgi:1,2-diacylglycerol-3-alpha-glucose alpha-1,2-galactosyltransferase